MTLFFDIRMTPLIGTEMALSWSQLDLMKIWVKMALVIGADMNKGAGLLSFVGQFSF